jgi:ABC-type Fe3+/spermidine/putrescine transport system ATPase subunit
MNAIEICQLQCGYQEQAILQDISFVLEERKILALLGASGCGKTTLLKAIAGLLPIDHGQIYLHGQQVQNGSSGLDPEARGVGFIFQDYALFPHMTVHDNLMFGLRPLRLKEAANRKLERYSDFASMLAYNSLDLLFIKHSVYKQKYIVVSLLLYRIKFA